MIEDLFSPYWYRVKELQPELKRHTDISLHEYRGESWYVIRDSITARNHRISANAYQFVSLMDGQHTVDAIWERCNELLGDDSPSQQEVIQLLASLHSSDLMQSEVSPALEELLKRGEKRNRMQRASYFKNPAALRFPLFDPDAFLGRTVHWVRPLFDWKFFALFCVLCLLAAVQAGQHWDELSAAVSEQALQPYNIALLIVLYPLVKILHELGHAYAVKIEQGEVHELGVMLLVLMPIPYVDASASAAFPQRHKRILVAAAGMMVELALSALALFVWLILEPGLLRDIMLNIVLIGGVSTLLFNGNPLLRYDAYYMLADSLGMPNLAQRSNRYIAYLLQRYLFGIRSSQSPVSAEGERKWLLFYSIASFIYRTVLMLSIALYLAGKMFVLGVLMALWLLVMQFLLPVWKMLAYLVSERLGPHRQRAMLVSAGAMALMLSLLVLVPAPSNTLHEGVVWVPGEARVSSEVDALVQRVLVSSGQPVVAGQGLLELDGPELHAELAQEAAKLRELQAMHADFLVNDRVQAVAIQDKLEEAAARVARAQEKVDALLLTSPADGLVTIPNADDLPGRVIQKGELLAFIMNDNNARVRVVVNQSDQDRIQQGVERVQVRLDSDLGDIIDASLNQTTPQANRQLPSRVLSTAGGGRIVVDPSDETGLQALDTLFQYELEIPLRLADAQLGMRAYVRFDHGLETLSQQMWRRTRQLFLKHFDA